MSIGTGEAATSTIAVCFVSATSLARHPAP
jgi:hypothetical protein